VTNDPPGGPQWSPISLSNVLAATALHELAPTEIRYQSKLVAATKKAMPFLNSAQLISNLNLNASKLSSQMNLTSDDLPAERTLGMLGKK
jgi:hypothetical protein